MGQTGDRMSVWTNFFFLEHLYSDFHWNANFKEDVSFKILIVTS